MDFMVRFTLLVCLFSTAAVAQDGRFALGARNHAVAGAAINNTDLFALFNNVGSFGALDQTGAFVSYQNRYALKNLQVIGGGFALHTRAMNLGLKYFKFGDDLFSQQLAGIGIGNQFQWVSLGCGFNLLQTRAEGQQTHYRAAMEFGGRAEIISNLFFGASIFNLVHTRQYPTTMKAGLSWIPINVFGLTVEVEKQLDFPALIKYGVEIYLLEKLAFRTGLCAHQNLNGSYQTAPAFGVGLQTGVLTFDYAFRTISVLGAIHEVSLSSEFLKK